jgi:Na+/melibiose symporter-like transporter
VLIFGTDSGAARLLLPGIMVLWALAMTTFRSPALSLLGRYAFGTNLPRAASILTMVGGVAGAMGPLANQFILGLGPMFAFSIGSIVLLGAAASLQFVDPNRDVQPEVMPMESELPVKSEVTESDQQETATESATLPAKLSLIKLCFVFGAGVGVALGFRLLMQNFPRVITTQIPEGNKGLILGSIFIALAVSAIPSGGLATRLGNRLAMILGLVAMAVFCGLMGISQNSWIATGLAIALGSSLSLVSNGTIPFALSMVPKHRSGLGTGIYFSGGAVASSVFGAVFGQADAFTPTVGALIGAFAFLMAGGFVLVSTRFKPS